MSDEQITFVQASRMIELFRYNLETHLVHCHLCHEKWHCPDANSLQSSMSYWQKRLAALPKSQEEKK
jgi:hypothetical protein